jgi:hypothetical protein
MSRAAAREGFETFLESVVTATREEFSVGRALRGAGLGPGGMVVDRLHRNAEALERRVVEPELATYRERAIGQFDVVLEYAESDEPIEAFEEGLLEHDAYVESLEERTPAEKREALVGYVLERNRRLGDAMRPIVERPEEEFWPATTAAFDRAEATELVERAFPFTGPLRRHRDAIVLAIRLDPGDVIGGPLASGLPSVRIEYTDEAIRAMRRAEQRVIHETKAEIRDRFGPV